MQREVDGNALQLMLAWLSAVLAWRSAAERGFPLGTPAQIIARIQNLIACPWLMGHTGPTQDRKARKAARIPPTPVIGPEEVLYRSDGASRGQGPARLGVAGWGATVWEPPHTFAPSACAHGHLGSASNNIAEYQGLRHCMQRATRVPLCGQSIVFQIDSDLDRIKAPKLPGFLQNDRSEMFLRTMHHTGADVDESGEKVEGRAHLQRTQLHG